MEFMEQIGKVTLNYKHYPGEDFYCDGAVEDELLDIAKNYSAIEFGRIIEERKSWPILYHLSGQRENIVSWLPLNKDMKVLEIGSGCGAITGALANKSGSVTCIDLSKKRSLINAYRHEECDNVTIHVGNFQDIEPELENDYDYALLIGVFEYGQCYIGGKTPFEDFLKIIRKHVKKDGNIVIAIENKYGLKYWAGCREDHLGTFFSSIENYPSEGEVRTFSKKGLERIFKSCGEKEYSFYYPYPDYKFMTTLYSDRFLPKKGELVNNMRNFDRDRMLLFDEKKVFDGLIEDGMFPFYSNSFMVVLGNQPETEYIRYSNDRAPKYQISTEILMQDGEKIVKKHALSNEASSHISKMKEAYKLLSKRYDTKEFSINPVLDNDEKDTVSFPFEKGTTLSGLMDECLEHNDEEAFLSLFREFVKHVERNSDMPIADLDLVFSNILVNKKEWKVIDYEWTTKEKIPTREIAFRSLYCYLLEDEKRNKFNFDLIMEELGITEGEADEYRNKEIRFQESVTGKRLSMPALRELLGGAVIVPQKSLMKEEEKGNKNRIQIYEDDGSGFSEEHSYFVKEPYDADGNIEFVIDIESNIKKIRLDPCMATCIVRLNDISFNNEIVKFAHSKRITSNGKLVIDEKANLATVTFATEDPNIAIDISDIVRSTGNKMTVKMQMIRIPETIAKALEHELRRKIRL